MVSSYTEQNVINYQDTHSKNVLFIIADSWKSIKSSTVTSSLYNDLRVGSHGDEKDTHTDQRVTTLITGDCRQLGLGHIVKPEIDVCLN